MKSADVRVHTRCWKRSPTVPTVRINLTPAESCNILSLRRISGKSASHFDLAPALSVYTC